MSIRVDGVQELNLKLKELGKFMTKTEKRRITFAAAKPIVEAGRSVSPVRSVPDKWGHPRENPRYSKSKKGTIIARYLPGNLKKSFRRIPQQRLKKSSSSFVGPFSTQQRLGLYGGSVAKSDGYYATMAFGKGSTAADYENKILKVAVTKAGKKTYLEMQKKARQVWEKAKTGLNFR